MDNFSTNAGTGYPEICVTQILTNIFRFLGSVNCDESLQRHCQEIKRVSTKKHKKKITYVQSRQD